MTRPSQIETHNVSLVCIIRSAAFVRGYQEALSGKPFNYEFAPRKLDELWNYERGRQFAMIWNGPLKHRNRVTTAAKYQYTCAILDGSVN
jgi:hypothetical protein